ncbi:sigma-54 dependent transcriptional regulator [uncultured Duncaniella sp.]|uniref:sigma-54-dependent transcriptional regulator n=1 Tax=uncultured Duncaniella sp. TaxID=2768039 RepID=UPI0026759FD3|nr:sigma 54-interacting transcriptional regulator [uncultured Duncaniella sp.]
MNKVLIVDASASDGRIMVGLLTRAGYDPVVTDCIEAGKVEAAKLPPGAVIVTAMRLSDGTAKEFINWLKTEGYKFPVIAIVDNLHTDAVDVMRGGGAVDVVQRLALDKQLIETVEKYAKPEHIVLTLDNQLIPRVSEAWQKIEEKIQAIAVTNANAIIFGECGSGKEQVAHQIYLNSSWEQKPITVVDADCAALVGKHNPGNERSEIYNRIEGYFHKSEEGTIIVKNVHLLSFEKQSVLLHILETEHPDVRVICTAEPELMKMVTEKTFRPNLFYILRQSDISVPSLKETTEDIPEIADFFLKRYAAQTGKPRKHLDASAIKALKLYPWPGNVRELKDIVLFAVIHAKGDTITAADISFNLSDASLIEDLHMSQQALEKYKIEDALTRTGWIKSQAAKLLKISRTTLDYKIKQYGLSQS